MIVENKFLHQCVSNRKQEQNWHIELHNEEARSNLRYNKSNQMNK